jgi:hypothetical protein
MSETQELVLRSSETLDLEIPTGWFVVVAFTTQADYRWTIKIADDKQVYFEKSRQSSNPNPPEWSSFKAQSDKINLQIDVPQASSIALRFARLSVTDNSGNIVAKTITLVGEDGCDQDYNDILLSIATWKNAG